MTVSISAYVEDITTAMDTTQDAYYDEIQLYRDTSPTGGFSTLVDTVSLVADQNLYTLSDSSGTINNVYRWRLHHSTQGFASELSPVFYPEGYSLLRLRLDMSRQANGGFDGTCSDDGTTTTLVDVALTDTGQDDGFLAGTWLYRPNAALTTDKVRRVVEKTGFNTTTGALTVSRAWSNAPASSEVYQVFNFYPPIDWSGVPMSYDRIIRDALRDVWFVDQLDLGVGTTTRKRRFDLGDFADVQASQVRRVWRRTTDDNGNICDVDADTQGGFWRMVENGPGDLSIDVYPVPLTTESIIAEVNRNAASLYNDDDVIGVDALYAKKVCVAQLFTQLNTDQPGKYGGELAMATAAIGTPPPKPSAVLRGI